MRVQFYLRFYTHSGQNLFISGNIDALGNNDPEKAFPINYLNDEFWHGTLDITTSEAAKIQYHYFFEKCRRDNR